MVDSIIQPNVSPLIERQFPEFYRENSPLFVEFLRQYFLWMESDGQALYHVRRLPSYHDVDLIPDDLIVHLKQKYLPGIQLDTKTDVRRLIKHSLDLYRTKGTPRSVDLLFRLVYGTGADVYYPSTDVFRLSDGVWAFSTYLEVEPGTTSLNDFIGYQIKGTFSGATAFVERVARKKLPNKYVDIVYISTVTGTFQDGETFNREFSPLDISTCPTVIGSLSYISVVNGGENYAVGDIVSVESPHGWGGLGRVSTVGDQRGTVSLTLLDGGYGYSNAAQLLVSDKVLSLIVSDSIPGDYVSLFDDVKQEMADVTYSSANGVFSPGDSVFTYDANGSVTGIAEVMSATELSPGEGVFRINVLYGDLSGGPFYTTGNVVMAQESAGGYAPDVAIGNTIGIEDVTLNFPFPVGYQKGEEIYQINGPVTTVKDFIPGNTGIIINASNGQFQLNTPIIGRSSGYISNATFADLKMGVLAVSGIFSPGVHSWLTLPSGQNLRLGSVSQGAGFNASLGEIDYPETIEGVTDYILPYSNVALSGVYGFPSDPTANGDTVIADSLGFAEVDYGEVRAINVLNPGSGYNIPPIVRVYEPRTFEMDERWWILTVDDISGSFTNGEIITQSSTGARGKLMSIDLNKSTLTLKRMSLTKEMSNNSTSIVGTTSGASANVVLVTNPPYTPMMDYITGIDAQVQTESTTANGVAETIDVLDSGLGYLDSEIASISPTTFMPVDPDSPAVPGTAYLFVRTQGHGQGYYRKKGGFLSDQKKLFDGEYYQDFSYEIDSPIPFDHYSDMVKRVTHPAGTRMFGALMTNGGVGLDIEGSMELDFPVYPDLSGDFIHGTFTRSNAPDPNPYTFSRGSVATYFDENGVLQTGPVDFPRPAYDPITRENQGVLLEGSYVENLLEHDEELDNNYWWYKVNASIVPNSSISVWGTTSMDKLVEDTTANTHFVTAAVGTPITPNTQCVASIDIKAGERTHAAVALMNNASAPYENATVFIDLETGNASMTPTGVTNPSYGVMKLPHDIYRVWVTCLLGPTVTQPSLVVWTSDGTSTFYTGDGSSGIYLDRAQIEVGTLPTSFIPTSSSPVTKNPDIMTLPLAFNIGSASLTITARALPGWNYMTLGQLDPGELNQNGTFRFSVDNVTVDFYYQEPDGADNSLQLFSTIDVTQPVTVKYSWSGKMISVSLNGGDPITMEMNTPASDFNFKRLVLGQGSWFPGVGAIIESYRIDLL